MKTPREILLQKHQPAEPRLEALCERVLGAELSGHKEAPAPILAAHGSGLTALPLTLWRELILPVRHVWGALAAVWVVLAAMHFSERKGTGASGPVDEVSAKAALAAAQQEEILLATLQYYSIRTVPKPEVPPLPRPRPEKDAEAEEERELSWV